MGGGTRLTADQLFEMSVRLKRYVMEVGLKFTSRGWHKVSEPLSLSKSFFVSVSKAVAAVCLWPVDGEALITMH